MNLEIITKTDLIKTEYFILIKLSLVTESDIKLDIEYPRRFK